MLFAHFHCSMSKHPLQDRILKVNEPLISIKVLIYPISYQIYQILMEETHTKEFDHFFIDNIFYPIQSIFMF